MKTFIFTILCLFLLMNSSLAQNSSCCKEPSAPVIMASFGDDKEFRDAHPTPLPFSLTDGKGRMITFKRKQMKLQQHWEMLTFWQLTFMTAKLHRITKKHRNM